MKKFFSLMVVFAALFAAGCAENDTMAPPAEDQAAPAEEAPVDGEPVDEATETP